MPEFASAAEMQDHYRAVSDRLWNGQTPPPTSDQIIARLELEIKTLRDQIRSLDEANAHLAKTIQAMRRPLFITETSGHTLVSGPGADYQFKRALRICANAYRVTPAEIMGQARAKRIIRARHHFWKLLSDRGWGKAQLGRKCNKDHTSIVYGIAGHKRRAAGRKEK